MVRDRIGGTVAAVLVCGVLVGCSAATESAEVAEASSAGTATSTVSASAPAVASEPPASESALSRPADPAPSVDVAPRPPVPESSEVAYPPTLDARSPEEVVARSGDRGRRYLDALRGAGLPPIGMDAAEILYADGTCRALAAGTPRSEVLGEFDGVADAYARFTPLPADRVAEIYVDTAERTYC